MTSATRWVVKSAVTVGLGLLVGVTPAVADWNYTQWGMSPAEVKLASQDLARDNPDRSLDAEGLTAELVAPYQGDTLAFTAVFLFDDASRLRYVSLNSSESSVCPKIMQHLASHYGPPEGGADMVDARTLRWDDVTGDNLVVFLDLGQGGCSVQYSKLPATRPNGKSL